MLNAKVSCRWRVWLAAFGTATVVGDEVFGGFESDFLLGLDLGAEPNAEFENPLEFLGAVVPTVVVAEGMGGQVVVEAVRAAAAMREDVIGFPVRAINEPAADVTTAAGFAQHFNALRFRQRNAFASAGFGGGNSITACSAQSAQFSSESCCVCECLVCKHGS